MKHPVIFTAIRILHTIIWIFFNIILGYLFFAVVKNRLDKWVWIGLSCFLVEGIVLLIFKNVCPLTIWARRYSDSEKNNFDIYLPDWLAKYNKIIYGSLLSLVLVLLIYRLVMN